MGVRFHGLFDDDMGPVLTADSAGAGVYTYNWTLVDKLWDGVLAAGVDAPIVELSYMPRAIANCSSSSSSSSSGSPCRTTHYYRGITEHPTRWELWHDLVRAFAANAVGRYGIDAGAKVASLAVSL